MHAFALVCVPARAHMGCADWCPSACPLVTHQPRASVSGTHAWGKGAGEGADCERESETVCVCVYLCINVRGQGKQNEREGRGGEGLAGQR